MVKPQVGSTTSTRDVYSRRGPARLSHDPGRGNTPYPAAAAAATLGMSVYVWCVWCRSYWLTGGGRSRSRVCAASHGMAHELCCMSPHRTRHRFVWIQSSGVFVPVVRGGKSLLEMGRGDGDCPSFTPRLASICCCFSTAQNRHRTLRTCSSAKGKRLGMAWHGMAWRAVLFAWHVGVQILPRASPRGSWCFMPSSRHPVHLSQDSTSIWPVNQTNLHQMGPGCFLRTCPSWEPSACMSRAIPKLPSTSQKGADGGGGGGGGTI